MQKCFSLMQKSVFIFALGACGFGVLLKTVLTDVSRVFFLMFSSKSFQVLYLSQVHFELIFVYSVR